MRTKEPINLSLSLDTKARLKAYAKQRHTTVSQAITDWIWAQPVKEESQDGTGTEEPNDD